MITPMPCPCCMEDLPVEIGIVISEPDAWRSVDLFRQEFQRVFLDHIYLLPAYEGER